MRIDYRDAIARSGVLVPLAAFDPHVVGTPPLGVDMPDSDIDIVCEVIDHAAFGALLRQCFARHPDFHLRHCADLNATIGGFTANGWAFEIFGQSLPVARQHGWRHFLVEQRLLTLGGDALRDAIIALRGTGLKTEPAFAQHLGLAGDPYAALLTLEPMDDMALAALLGRASQRA